MSVEPRGAVVCMAGPDGVGKSSLAERLIHDVLSDSEVKHLRFPRLLPRRDPVTRREARLGKGGVPDPRAERVYPLPYPSPVAVAKTLYLFVDWVLGWMLRLRPFVASGGWVVMERGWWDHAVDPRRYRLRPGARLPMWLGRILQQPDLIVVLEAPPEVVLERKPQLKEDELLRQMRAWRSILPPRQRRIYVDASLPLDDVVRTVALELERLPRRGAIANLSNDSTAGE